MCGARLGTPTTSGLRRLALAEPPGLPPRTATRPSPAAAGSGTPAPALPREVPYSANYSALPIPDGLDLTDCALPTGVSMRVLEPRLRYALGYEDADRLRADLTFDAVMPRSHSPRKAPPSGVPATSTNSAACTARSSCTARPSPSTASPCATAPGAAGPRTARGRPPT